MLPEAVEIPLVDGFIVLEIIHEWSFNTYGMDK